MELKQYTMEKVLKMMNDFREWNKSWEIYERGVGQKPIDANEFAKNLVEIYNIKSKEDE